MKTSQNNFAIQGLTLNNNIVVQYKGLNIYLGPDGSPIRFEKAWFEIENPKRILSESAEYLLKITKMKMLREGMYFIGHVQKHKDGTYKIITWDHTYYMFESKDLEEIKNFILSNAYYEDEIDSLGYRQIAHKIPFDKNGIVLKSIKEGYGQLYYEL